MDELLRLAASAKRNDGGGRGSGRDEGNGGRGNGYQNNNNRRDDHNNSFSGRGGRINQHHGRGGHDNRNHGGGRYNSYRDNRRGAGYNDNNHSRKRGRYNDNDRNYQGNNDGRYHSNNNYHGRGGGYNNSDRSGLNNQDVPMADLVVKVAEKYKSSQEEIGNESTEDNTTTNKKQRHIALLFLTIDDLPHEHVWKEWLQSSSANYLSGDRKDNDVNSCEFSNNDDSDVMVSVLCHTKYPERIKSSWLRQRHLLQRRTHHVNNDNKKASSKADNYEDIKPKFHSRRPEWGSIEITRAMIDLLEEGMRIGTDDSDGSYHRYLSTPTSSSEHKRDEVSNEDTKPSPTDVDMPPVDRFIFVSESCLPVATLKEVELALFGPRQAILTTDTKDGQIKQQPKNMETLYNKSWINARSTPNNGYARQLQWDAIRQTDIPQNLIWKADQWLVLIREHADAIVFMPNKYLEGQQLWSTMRKVRASDEMYFPTALSILGILHRPVGVSEVDENTIYQRSKESCAGNSFRRRCITYCDWSMGAKNPVSFTSLDWKDVVAKARGAGCLFARKFVSASSLAIRGGGKNNDSGGAGDGLVSVDAWRSAVVAVK